MDEKVKQFLKEAKSKEREAFEKERDEFLISIGLVDDTKTIRKYSPEYGYPYLEWDMSTRKYFYDSYSAVEVTDEEYKELKKYYGKKIKKTKRINNTAEIFLAHVNAIVLIIGILASVILLGAMTLGKGDYLLIASIGILIISIISWAVIKTFLNISNNLHEINSKLK